jgi:hypothetical protein
LTSAGLEVDVVTAGGGTAGDTGLTGSFPPGSLVGVSPSLGSVVEEGAAVTVTVAG